MKTIIIDNKIQLIKDYTYLNIVVICPKRNIQKMLETTKSKFIFKEKIGLDYNHHAGDIYRVLVYVKFTNIVDFLPKTHIQKADNFKDYLDLININTNNIWLNYDLSHCYENIITGIYTFGSCSVYPNFKINDFYFDKNGKKITLNKSDKTNFGKKRYVKNNNKWYSNKKY
jgi:hypothetical protein